jgi:hypothetical protein
MRQEYAHPQTGRIKQCLEILTSMVDTNITRTLLAVCLLWQVAGALRK